MLLYAFIPFTPFYLLLMYKLSPPQQQQDRWSRVNRLYLAEAGKKQKKNPSFLKKSLESRRLHFEILPIYEAKIEKPIN